MAGRLSANTRSGILAEKLGVLLLQEVSAVATVIEADDFGVDAICTLLHPREKWTRATAATFYTQLKAVSIHSVTYVKHEIEWFFNQELPFFIGRVNRKSSAIQIYTCIKVYDHLLRLPSIDQLITLTLVFEESKQFEHLSDPKIYLGPPIIEWSTEKLDDEAFHKNAFNCLQSWVELERRNALTRPIGYILTPPNWTPAKIIKPTKGSIDLTIGRSENRKRSIKQATPALQVLLLDLLITGSKEDVEWATELIEQVRKLGGEIDPGGYLISNKSQLRNLGTKFRNPCTLRQVNHGDDHESTIA